MFKHNKKQSFLSKLIFRKRWSFILITLALFWNHSDLPIKAQEFTLAQSINTSKLSINLKQNEATLAIQEWSRNIQDNTNIEQSLYNRAQAYIVLKQYQFAIKDLDRLLTIQSKKNLANVYILRGISLTESNQVLLGIESFKQAERLKPSPFVYNNRALAYQNLGKLDLALEDLKKSVKLSPIPPHQLNLANLQIQLGQYQQAIQITTQILSEDSTFYPAYTTRGIGYFNLNLFETAIQEFVQSLRIKPDQPEAFYYSGLAFNKLDRKKDAAQNFLRAADLYLQTNQAILYQQVLDKMLELKLQ